MSDGDRVFVLTPKGVLVSVLEGGAGFDSTQDAVEQQLERLYVHAQRKISPGEIPAIAFIDGKWQFVGISQ